MNAFGLRFHHFGLAVCAPEAAFRYLEGLGYTRGEQVFDPLQRVNVAMRHHREMPDVEVIWPNERPSPIDNFIKRGHGHIYHLCYEADDPAAALAAIAAAGLDVASARDPLPAVLFSGAPVSFHYIGDFGLIELIHPTPDS